MGDAGEAFPCPWCAAPVAPEGEPIECPACHASLVVCTKYRIVGHVARTVYRGLRVTDRHTVAIKIVAPPAPAAGDHDWTAWELFERSCKVLEQLHHRALPKVYAFERTETGSLVLVREDFDGGTLEERVTKRDERHSPDEVKRLLRDLLDLLVYLQGRVPPVIHRDIKPSNIMFRGPSSFDPVLVDFDTVVSRRSGLTIVGTPGYAPPEQFAAEAVPASDVYGVGATLLFVATHVEPDDLPREAGRFALGDRLDPLGGQVARVLRRMVEPDLAHRYANAKEALADLNRAPTAEDDAARAGGRGGGGGAAGSPSAKSAGSSPTQGAQPTDLARRPGESRRAYRRRMMRQASAPAAQQDPARRRVVPILVVVAAIAGFAHSISTKLKAKHHDDTTTSDEVDPDPDGNLALDAKCKGGDGTACFDLGVRHDFGKNGLEVDHDKAMPYYELACAKDDADGCNNLGAGYGKGVGAPKDEAKAATFYEKACKLKSNLGCANLAWFYADGTGVKKDAKKAIALRDEACDLGNGDACNRAGVTYEYGDEGVPVDAKQAASHYGLACDHDFLWGCRNYAISLRDGDGVDQDERRAVALFQRVCDGKEPDGCYQVGRMARDGRGTAKDVSRAADLFDQACKDGSMDACDALGDLYARGEGKAKSPRRAKDLFEKACDGGAARGCGDLAGVETDPTRAAELRASACDGGDTRSCDKPKR